MEREGWKEERKIERKNVGRRGRRNDEEERERRKETRIT